MNSPEVTAAKMICKSIDALTREIHLMRKEVLDGWTEIECGDARAGQGSGSDPPLTMNR